MKFVTLFRYINSALCSFFTTHTTVVGLISGKDEAAYREEVQRLTDWCRANNLSLNVEKTKEMVVDFRRAQRDHSPLSIGSSSVEIVQSTKFLGVHITENLTWTLNTSSKTSAEERYLQENFTNRSQEQKPFLHHFTNSPAFREESRYGSYRFKFLLVDLMELYQEQLCGGEEPVLRVMKTMFYLKEIVYAVLIHSPQYNKEFAELPLLENSEFVRYQDGKMVWRAQAISDSLEYELLVTAEGNPEVRRLSYPKYYVWDNVALAFYLPIIGKGLQVPRERLIEALEACRISEINLFGKKYSGEAGKAARDAHSEKAEKRVAELKEELEDKMETENAIKHEPKEDD